MFCGHYLVDHVAVQGFILLTTSANLFDCMCIYRINVRCCSMCNSIVEFYHALLIVEQREITPRMDWYLQFSS